MHAIVLVPNERLDVLWLDGKFEMNHTTWNNIVGHWPDYPAVGQFDNLGGIFTTPPVAVPLGENRLDVFGLGTDYAVYHKTFQANATGAGTWTPNWENLGGNFMSTPAVASTGPDRIDIFALGIDQGMVHKAWNGTAWDTNWEELGGCFASPPMLVAGTAGAYDVFGRGLDYMIYHLAYKPGASSHWNIVGGPLLGAPVAASAPAAIRVRNSLYLFVAGSDGAMWMTLFDGKIWRPWSSLGPASKPSVNGKTPAITFASEPVPAAFFPRIDIAGPPIGGSIPVEQRTSLIATIGSPGNLRIDVFAVGSDRALWHNWMDANGWRTNWESLGGILGSAPAIVANSVSKVPEAPPPVRFSVLEPGFNEMMRPKIFDGTSWSYPWNFGPLFSMPNAFVFDIAEVNILSLRSNGSLGQSDTDYATVSLAVGKWPLMTKQYAMGDVGTGTHELNEAVNTGLVPIELCEPVVFFYIINNQGHSDTNGTVAGAIAKGTEDWVNDLFKQLVNPDTTAVLAGAGITVVTAVGGGPVLIGSLIGAAVAAILDETLSLAFANCDGPVASGTLTYLNGRALQQQMRATTHHHLTGAINSPGTDSPSGCGGNSNYTVTWTIDGQ
ncbi:hypothetical protein [Bradyrhizobium sp. S69]|uniref:hypothetical protein n=1 Tax=Bradyrhizobium sp. S69 TaxID=1641856 RepID=UPI00131CC807|nr:hypothetical protein [Bradyrhizobium sp. S69]